MTRANYSDASGVPVGTFTDIPIQEKKHDCLGMKTAIKVACAQAAPAFPDLDGSELATPLGETVERLLYAALDPAALIYAKAAADPVGHYSRPDGVKPVQNRTAQRNVMRFDEAASELVSFELMEG